MPIKKLSVKQQTGLVISNKMQKTIVVKIEKKCSHPMYSKTILRTKNYLVHDDLEKCKIGDQVVIQECRPLSKKKRWKLVKIILKSSYI